MKRLLKWAVSSAVSALAAAVVKALVEERRTKAEANRRADALGIGRGRR